jgi:hypothetical protein
MSWSWFCVVAIRYVIQVLEGDVACGCLLFIVTYRMNVRYQNLHVFRYCASRMAANMAKYMVIKKCLGTWLLYCNHQVHRDFLITLFIAVNSEHTNACSFPAVNFIYSCIYYYIVSLWIYYRRYYKCQLFFASCFFQSKVWDWSSRRMNVLSSLCVLWCE